MLHGMLQKRGNAKQNGTERPMENGMKMLRQTEYLNLNITLEEIAAYYPTPQCKRGGYGDDGRPCLNFPCKRSNKIILIQF